jgi:hypothetical protein
MNPSFKAIAVTLLAGVIAGSMAACSKDLPTGPADKPGTRGPLPSVSLLVAPTNDDFDNATVIAALPFTDNVNTSEATVAADDPLNDETCGFGSIGGHTVWYQFTPTENMRINASTVGSNYDPNVFVYTGTRGNLARIACNFLPQSMTFDALAGETYFFLVGPSDGEPGGNLVFKVDVGLEVGVTIDPLGRVSPSTGVVTISGTVTCSRSAFFELGGAVQQRKVFASQGSLFASSNCDGVTRWEGEVVGENGRFVGGPAEVSAVALFTADATTEERHSDPVSAAVRLRGQPAAR